VPFSLTRRISTQSTPESAVLDSSGPPASPAAPIHFAHSPRFAWRDVAELRVRRAFLCGVDDYSGRNYEHRRAWISERLKELSSIFGVEVFAYAVMSNHTHIVIRNRPDLVKDWAAEEVARRWCALFLKRKGRGAAEAPCDAWCCFFRGVSVPGDEEIWFRLGNLLMSRASWIDRLKIWVSCFDTELETTQVYTDVSIRQLIEVHERTHPAKPKE